MVVGPLHYFDSVYKLTGLLALCYRLVDCSACKSSLKLLNITLVSFNIMLVILVSLVRARKVGGSLVVTLPKELVESKKIREGEIVEIIVNKVRKDGFGVFKGMTSFTVKDELTAHE